MKCVKTEQKNTQQKLEKSKVIIFSSKDVYSILHYLFSIKYFGNTININ